MKRSPWPPIFPARLAGPGACCPSCGQGGPCEGLGAFDPRNPALPWGIIGIATLAAVILWGGGARITLD